MKTAASIISILVLIATFGTVKATSLLGETSADSLNFIDKNKLKQGFWIFYGKDKLLGNYEDEDKVEEGSYQDDRKSGIWKKYFATGKLQNEITYKNSVPNGHAKIYYANGQLKQEGIWKRNKWTGVYVLYHENGNKYHEFNFSDKGKREGTQKYYDEDGRIIIEGEWIGGQENGIVKEFWPDGSTRSEKNFDGGVLDQASVKTYPKPESVAVAESKIEEPKGDGIKVADTDHKRNLVTFKGHGEHTFYDKNHLQITKSGVFKDHKLVDGKWHRYNKGGLLTHIEVYKNGSYVGNAPMPTEL